jgi:hypothetical protein
LEAEPEPAAELALLKTEPHYQHVYEPLEETAKASLRAKPELAPKHEIAPKPVMIAKAELKPETKTTPKPQPKNALFQRLFKFGPTPLPGGDEEV